MFEGARRIAKLIAVFIVAGFAIAIFADSSRQVYLKNPYLISEAGGAPVLGIDCMEGAKSESVEITSRKGVRVHVSLCLLYAASQRATFDDLFFKIPEADEEMINSLWWSQTLKNASLYLLGMIASLVGLWAFTWTVGWIVRGFVGGERSGEGKIDDAGNGFRSLLAPRCRLSMYIALAVIGINIFVLVGSSHLVSVQAEQLDALATTGQQEVMKVMEAKRANARAQELVEFQKRLELERGLASEALQVWAVRSISYLVAKDANDLVAELGRHGIPSFTESRKIPEGVRTEVYVGPYQSKEEAEAGRNRLRNVLGFAGSVTRIK